MHLPGSARDDGGQAGDQGVGHVEGGNGQNSSNVPGSILRIADGQAYAVTDNDGIDEATGESLFIRLGDFADALDLLTIRAGRWQ